MFTMELPQSIRKRFSCPTPLCWTVWTAPFLEQHKLGQWLCIGYIVHSTITFIMSRHNCEMRNTHYQLLQYFIGWRGVPAGPWDVASKQPFWGEKNGRRWRPNCWLLPFGVPLNTLGYTVQMSYICGKFVDPHLFGGLGLWIKLSSGA